MIGYFGLVKKMVILVFVFLVKDMVCFVVVWESLELLVGMRMCLNMVYFLKLFVGVVFCFVEDYVMLK